MSFIRHMPYKIKTEMVANLSKLAVGLVVILFVYDMTEDLFEGESLLHCIFDFFCFSLIVSTLLLALWSLKKLLGKIDKQSHELRSLKGGLAEVVEEQFETWSLTKSEKEVAWLIIKGFSFSEIAGFRSVNEKTIRQQATSIYRKSDTQNRSDFTALFLNDIFNIQESLQSDAI